MARPASFSAPNRGVRPLLRAFAQACAPAYLRVCSLPAVRRAIAPHLTNLPPGTLYSPNGIGLDQRSELRLLNRLGGLRDKSALIVGIGGGDEILDFWLEHHLARVTALDLISDIDYKDTVGWKEVRRRASDAGLSVTFAIADGRYLPFEDKSFELVYSHSVLEHVADITTFLAEMRRVLRPGGLIYAMFGPLWFTHCGPHAPLAYDHLLLPFDKFVDRVREVGEPWQIRFMEQGLYNRLQFDAYLESFRRHFRVRRVALAGSPDGSRFSHQHPEVWNQLTKQTNEAALLTRLVSVIAERTS